MRMIDKVVKLITDNYYYSNNVKALKFVKTEDGPVYGLFFFGFRHHIGCRVVGLCAIKRMSLCSCCKCQNNKSADI